MLYRLLLYVHIFSVILSIGPFFVLLPLIKKLRASEAGTQQAYLDIFRFSVRLAKHAGHVLVASGVLLVLAGPWTWKTPWIVMTLILMASSLFFLARAFSPTIRKFGEKGQDKDALIQLLRRSVWIYIVLLMAMLWFMVTKPALWQG
ncbi:hypothetical protein ACIGHG_07050 [Bacillus sp. NPDC077411]|uniref:DUF2269 family protein n=1 Tax=Bacillus bruguierae TaxID=3127667 RepID=A0ABU8FP31_9BACI|nr:MULTISPECIES: hypothetical protein [unclassified Bacillus (in: firmicutes)]SFI39668.1 hypothetical protein SAMN04488574_102560 [Bacillus sp. 71mf]SFT10861.1 hypothetical protein SAMN04488145_11148 [Bacillus sp. 103mf]